ncbi:hypothetical protein ACHAQA_000107 [Verticillium albo-atrum]
MPTNLLKPSNLCVRCLRARLHPTSPPGRRRRHATPVRLLSSSARDDTNAPNTTPPAVQKDRSEPEEESVQGALSRRLEQATEDALTSGSSGARAIAEAGFSDELKDRLFEKVQAARFQDENAAAFAEAGLTINSSSSSSASAASAAAAAASATPWSGTETQHDAVLRMLDDAHKPLAPGMRGRFQIPLPVAVAPPRRQPRVKPSVRAANAREAAGLYADAKSSGSGGTEREEFREEMRRRFEPVARAVPATVSGLAALANRRIEEAIVGGKFSGIARGRGVRAQEASRNPYVDTTQDLMDRMIQRQGIVPPWIEKQQEVVREVAAFRARLRGDWGRHAARMIAAAGGGVEEQTAQAQRYAAAEARVNPRPRRKEGGEEAEPLEAGAGAGGEEVGPIFRDPAWELAERAYLTLSVDTLNSLTRSYNLMAPELAKKPYCSLERELKACFADVAPLLPDMIRDRGLRPARSLLGEGGGGEARSPGMLAQLGGEGRARVYDSTAPKYGFKEMWRDIWGKK